MVVSCLRPDPPYLAVTSVRSKRCQEPKNGFFRPMCPISVPDTFWSSRSPSEIAAEYRAIVRPGIATIRHARDPRQLPRRQEESLASDSFLFKAKRLDTRFKDRVELIASFG